VSFHRSFDGDGPLQPDADGPREVRKSERTSVVAVGTFACPACDAPVAPAGPLHPADGVACPYCAHTGRVRDFLSLDAPARPARVTVRVVERLRLARA
jgi:hypothetical protein